MSDEDTTDEYLVLKDEAGAYYAIPRRVVESYKVTGEKAAELEAAMGDDVGGFSMYQQYVNEHRASAHMADMNREAAEARLAASAESQGGDEGMGAAGGAGRDLMQRVGGFITGMWQRLPSFRPADTGE